ncbi:50S ribosomal protein L37e [Methanothrix sp.]|uniref:50S ribosomal protein L37e n=1 Tax=Methanothrix sp. TaxID=90426 RepID=UPI002BF18FBA|nr:50S ribosomal protein L37e [Methanothrix sp.]HOK58819.1 50S ribosomal protein L37e [Methanothrix sp.]HOL42799.1 50S ribosomal protein L37e [Methanothrix sp.]HPO89058.1 50S ribosomal protein L37e [Methanothrix sp.]
MSKGTPSMGKCHKRTHVRCRRCGRLSYNFNRRTCVACGFGRSKRLRSYKWMRKAGY